jgi:serine protease Do
MTYWMTHHRRCVLMLAALTFVSTAHAVTPTAGLQEAVRAATFEVVLRKADADPLTYEKPLPLELIPYAIRSDRYWSIGSAFAIGPNTFVSAGHVLASAVGSQFGVPALRDSAGHVYPVQQVIKFSAPEDFIVFSVAVAPDAVPLATTSDHKLDETVFAAGNALGEGVVIRDGLLTSETPEDQDGRWKWLRFSAAASPGNSGGPLLNDAGKVIGVVSAKSPNENLNYALPISRVLNGSSAQAEFDQRYSIKLPNARAAQVATLKTQFTLPKSFADFAHSYHDVILQSTRDQLQRLQIAQADQLFPKGNSAKLLASVYAAPLPAFVQQDKTDAWDIVSPDNVVDQDLPNRGLVSVGSSLGLSVFRLRRPGAASDAKFYETPDQFMDLLLKGLKLTRAIGDQAIRITSLGHAQRQSILTDRFGRRWQVSYWPLGYSDAYLMSYALPVPEGYVGMLQLVASSMSDVTDEYMKLLANSVYVDYSGTLAQWKAYLGRRDLRPDVFEHVRLELDAQAVRYESPRLTLSLPKDVVNVSADSEVVLDMAYMLAGDKLTWDVGAFCLYKDQDRHTYVGLERHVKPADDSSKDLNEVWKRMSGRGSGFNGVAGHDDQFKNFWIHEAVGASADIDPATSVLYDVSYGTDASPFPRDMEEDERRLVQATHILEH